MPLQQLPPWRLPGPASPATRSFHAYCVGSAKSGTHSMAAIFSRGYRSRHEPQHHPMILKLLARRQGRLTDRRARRFLLRRDRQLQLEMDSSQLNGAFADLLPVLFPDAKFVLTIRDCYAFLRSVIDHQLARKASATWLLMREARFGGFSHSPHERVLAERGLFPIDGYLSYWARHNENVLRDVPPERLLVVRTHEIRSSLPRVAEFLSIPPETLDAGRSHSYPAANRFGILKMLDPTFVEDKIHYHCEPLMRRFFPTATLSVAAMSSRCREGEPFLTGRRATCA
jgi:hypothetical protein